MRNIGTKSESKQIEIKKLKNQSLHFCKLKLTRLTNCELNQEELLSVFKI